MKQALALILSLALLAIAPISDPQIDAMAARFVAAAESMRPHGIDPSDYFERLAFLERRITHVSENAPAQMRADLEEQKSLEFQLDDRLISWRPLPLPTAGSATVRLYAPSGEAPDPIGVYVPQSDARGRYALVVLLHGAEQTETDVISRELFRGLADRTHSILIAPYNGGSPTWGAAATRDLLTLVEKMRKLYPIDDKRMYLVGMSMGASSTFRIVASDGDRFAGVMSILGSLDATDAKAARLALRDRPVYMVSGGADPIMTPAVEARSYAALLRGCVAVGRYVAPSAGHDLYAASSAVERAWSDMFAGVIRSAGTRECSEMPGGIQ